MFDNSRHMSWTQEDTWDWQWLDLYLSWQVTGSGSKSNMSLASPFHTRVICISCASMAAHALCFLQAYYLLHTLSVAPVSQ